MQDWEWEVADQTRVEEFLMVYENEDLSEDERFLLMEIILQSLEDSSDDLLENVSLQKTLKLIDDNIGIHLHSVWYWSDQKNEPPEQQWRIAPNLRAILEKHQDRFSS